MAIQFVAGSGARNVFTQAAPSLTVDVGTGLDRLLVAVMFARGGTNVTISAATYNGVAVSTAVISAQFTNLKAFLLYLPNPASGSNTLSITPSATSGMQFEVQAAAFIGVDQTAPLDDFDSATGTSTTPTVPLVPTEDNELLFGGSIHEGAAASSTGGGWNTLFNNDNGAWVTSTSYSIQTTAANDDAEWTNAASLEWVAVAASFKATADANTSPSVVLDTADEAVFTTNEPTLLFTPTDAEADDVTVNIQIGDDPNLVNNGVTLADNYSTGSGANFHPQPSATLTWQGNFQVDDRPGQSFTGQGGILDKVVFSIQPENDSPDGTAYVRIYAHQGTFGTTSAPLNAADPADTPTPGWLAISDGVVIDDTSVEQFYNFNFTGSNRIRLEAGVNYVLVLDWVPTTSDITNTILIGGDAVTVTHPGNMYMDGFSEPNHGIHAEWDLNFEVHEEFVLLDKVSDTDTGFANVDTPADTDPFNSGDQLSFTVPPADTLPTALYHWRARAKDPSGTTLYGDWTAIRDFTVDTINSGAFTIDAIILNAVLTNFTADAIIQKSVATNFSADAVITQQTSTNFTADAIIQDAVQTNFSLDAVIEQTLSNTFTADAVIETAVTATLTQEKYRWRNDNGDEINATWRQAEDTPDTVQAHQTIRLRIQLDADGNIAPATFEIEFRIQGGGDTWEPLSIDPSELSVALENGDIFLLENGDYLLLE